MTRPTARAIGAIAVAGLLAGALSLTVGATSDHVESGDVRAATTAVTGWVFIIAGALAWRRRPDNRFRALTVGVGFLWFVRGFEAANDP